MEARYPFLVADNEVFNHSVCVVKQNLLNLGSVEMDFWIALKRGGRGGLMWCTWRMILV